MEETTQGVQAQAVDDEDAGTGRMERATRSEATRCCGHVVLALAPPICIHPNLKLLFVILYYTSIHCVYFADSTLSYSAQDHSRPWDVQLRGRLENLGPLRRRLRVCDRLLRQCSKRVRHRNK